MISLLTLLPSPLVIMRPCLVLLFASPALIINNCYGETLQAGAAKVDITDYQKGPVNDPLYARVLIVNSANKTMMLVTLDVVAVGEIGPVPNSYLPELRKAVHKNFGINPKHIIVNASHCHGIARSDLKSLTLQAVQRAHNNLARVKVGVGSGKENRISENRRLLLKSGRTVDVRHAYALPDSEEISGVGPIDPEIGILRLDHLDGRPLAVVYNFACHPIQGVPGGKNTADITGFSSRVIEENLGNNCIALFVQGCGGDINPVHYKRVGAPRHAEPLGNQLGLSTLKAIRKIECQESTTLKVIHETLTLPRGDRTATIEVLESRQRKTLGLLRGTSLNFETFLPLMVKYQQTPSFPSAPAHRYLHQAEQKQDDLLSLDEENRRNLKAYLLNIKHMEELTRIQTNLRLLRKHQASLVASGKRTIDVEVVAIRIGDFRLLTFPGELTVQIGLNLKSKANHKQTYIAGYTNGYIYYSPTAGQLRNIGHAQEDSDCLLAPEWQALFESKAINMLERLDH